MNPAITLGPRCNHDLGILLRFLTEKIQEAARGGSARLAKDLAKGLVRGAVNNMIQQVAPGAPPLGAPPQREPAQSDAEVVLGALGFLAGGEEARPPSAEVAAAAAATRRSAVQTL